jgi:hypothetical protein
VAPQEGAARERSGGTAAGAGAAAAGGAKAAQARAAEYDAVLGGDHHGGGAGSSSSSALEQLQIIVEVALSPSSGSGGGGAPPSRLLWLRAPDAASCAVWKEALTPLRREEFTLSLTSSHDDDGSRARPPGDPRLGALPLLIGPARTMEVTLWGSTLSWRGGGGGGGGMPLCQLSEADVSLSEPPPPARSPRLPPQLTTRPPAQLTTHAPALPAAPAALPLQQPGVD